MSNERWGGERMDGIAGRMGKRERQAVRASRPAIPASGMEPTFVLQDKTLALAWMRIVCICGDIGRCTLRHRMPEIRRFNRSATGGMLAARSTA